MSTFVDMYERGPFTKRIKAYLNEATTVSQFYNPANPTILGKWAVPFDGTVSESLMTQRTLLVGALHGSADVVATLNELAAVFQRLPEYLAVLRNAQNPNVPAPTLMIESDLQIVAHAILRLLFDDVRAEDFVSKFGGANSRVDFLLREVGVMVEIKMTRPTLTDKKLGEELLVDWGRYPRHPDCRAIFAVIYDPNRHVQNAASLIADLSRDDAEIPTRVIVVR